MKKIYLFPLIAATAMASQGAVPFLKGQPGTAPVKKEAPAHRAQQASTILNEDFSKFADGSESAPADEISYFNSYGIPEEMTAQPGWTGQGIHPAGGCVAVTPYMYYDYYDETEYPEQGFISTPPMNLGGTATMTFKAKNLPGSQASLWVAVCDDYYGPGDDQADYTLTDEWTEYTLVAKAASLEEPSYFQFKCEQGSMLIDDVRIDFKRDRLATPNVNMAINVSPTEFIASWDAVDGASAYRLNVICTEAPTEINTGEVVQSFDGINLAEDGYTIDAANPGYPEGWTISVSEHGEADMTTETGFVLSAPQAILFDEVGDMIESEVLPEPLDGLSFWMRPSSYYDEYSSMSLIRVELHHTTTDYWENIAHLGYFNVPEQGAIYEMPAEALGDDVDKVRLSLIQRGQVAFAIDDLTLHYRTRGTTAPLISDLDVEGTEYAVKDIKPENDYYYYVQAVDGDLVSGSSYTVWVDGIAGLKVTTAEPTSISSEAFTANWEPLGHATSYKVEGVRITSVATDMAGLTVIEESFDNINEGSVQNPGMDWVSPFDFGAKGWASTGWCSTNPAWAEGMAGTQGTNYWMGTAGLVYSPLLNLSGNGGNGFDVEATVVTTVDSFSDMEGNSYSEGVFVMVLYSPSDTQATASALIQTPVAGSTTAKVHVPTDPSMDLSSVIVAFMNMSGTSFFVDDVKITQDLKAGETLMAPCSIDVTSETSLRFENLDPSSDYGYSVTASTSRNYVNYVSLPSEIRVVNTSTLGVSDVATSGADIRVMAGEGSIRVTAPAATPCAVYTVSGACVASGSGESTFEVTAGIYIVRAGDRSFKVAVR